MIITKLKDPLAEASLLAECMDVETDPTEIVGSLTEKDFTTPKHRKVFRAIKELHEAGESVELTTVALRCQGMAGYVAEMVDRVPVVLSVERDIAKLKKATAQRDTLGIFERARQRCEDEGIDITLLIERLEVINKNTVQDTTVDLARAAEEQMDWASRVSVDRSLLRGVMTGVDGFDRLGGMHPGHLWILAARPSMGKTALMSFMARNASMIQQRPVLVFSQEMTAADLANLAIASEAKINTRNFSTGRFVREDFPKMHNAVEALQACQVKIDESPALHWREITKRAMALDRKHHFCAIFVDHLHLSRGDSDNKVIEVGEISAGLKTLAKRLDLPVCALAQLNRGVEDRTDKRPMLSDLRASGNLEQDADVVAMMYRDDYYYEDSQRKGIVDISIQKGRAIGNDVFAMDWAEVWTRFSNQVQYKLRPRQEVEDRRSYTKREGAA
jgi:replicative DNA helicase